MTLAPNGTAVWDLSTDEFGDAQLTAYVHANIAKQYALTLDPDLAWLHRPIVVHVNENDICNAYSELDDIYFLRAGGDGQIFCENSARVADIIYHEFGHSLHGQSFGFDIDDALSEGLGDYYGATLTGDPATGTGWIVPDEIGVRHIDPADKEYRWPDDIDGDPHVTGLIIAGALWDLRTALRAQLGDEPGKAQADKIFYGVLSRADDTPTAYPEALVADDDDGNLANGTPNKCAIDRAFGRHGLGELASATDSAAPELDKLAVRLAQLAPTGTAQCPGPQIVTTKVDWELRGKPDTKGSFELAMQGGAFAGNLPGHTGEVIRYTISATLDDGATLKWPRNPADPQYEIYDGPVTPIYCTDFETDPVAAGWTLTGFEWGAPAAAGNDTTDPSAGFAGPKVLGTGLAGAGNYAPEAMLKALSPNVDVGGHAQVRLQYRRWLAVEDHYYDAATIRVDSAAAWTNAENEFGSLVHVDREWRFHDVDLSTAAADGKVQVAFELTSDDFLELGGWNIDQFCIVAAGAPAPACGNGAVDGEEQCDDGNTADGDGCSAACTDEVEGGGDDDAGCCSANGETSRSLWLGLAVGLLLLRRRRR
jgi:cysteine-rich repeat protein